MGNAFEGLVLLQAVLDEQPIRPFAASSNCAELEDPDYMHPNENDWRAIFSAIRICAGCPAFDECRTEVDCLETVQGGRQSGIWAGETWDQRRARRRGRQLNLDAQALKAEAQQARHQTQRVRAAIDEMSRARRAVTKGQMTYEEYRGLLGTRNPEEGIA